MAHTVVADSDLLIDFLARAEPGRRTVRRLLTEDRLAVTSISIYELRVGFGIDPESDEGFREILGRHVLPLDSPAAMEAGEITRVLGERGTPIGLADSLIAGTCRSFGLPLATRNSRHFERVPDLELVPVEDE